MSERKRQGGPGGKGKASPGPAHVGALIRAGRFQAGHYEQQVAARRAGMLPGSLSRIETGASKPLWETAHRVIVRLGLPLELFYPAEAVLAAANRLRAAQRKGPAGAVNPPPGPETATGLEIPG